MQDHRPAHLPRRPDDRIRYMVAEPLRDRLDSMALYVPRLHLPYRLHPAYPSHYSVAPSLGQLVHRLTN